MAQAGCRWRLGFAVRSGYNLSQPAAPDMPAILLTGRGHRLLAENDTPEAVDRVPSKPPKLAALRLALAELTAAAPVLR